MPEARQQQARVNFSARAAVWVTPQDITSWDGYGDAVRSGMGREDILSLVAREKLAALDPNGQHGVTIDAEGAGIDADTIDWEALMHPASENEALDPDLVSNPFDFRERPPKESLSHRKEAADANPVTRQANDCLKIAKVLANLLNELAGLDQTSREQIATAAGLQQLPESIDRLYELADQLRMGGVQNLQVAYASVPPYCGWEPDALRRSAKPFVDSEARPAETVVEPEEKFRFPKEQASSPHAAEAPMDK